MRRVNGNNSRCGVKRGLRRPTASRPPRTDGVQGLCTSTFHCNHTSPLRARVASAGPRRSAQPKHLGRGPGDPEEPARGCCPQAQGGRDSRTPTILFLPRGKRSAVLLVDNASGGLVDRGRPPPHAWATIGGELDKALLINLSGFSPLRRNRIPDAVCLKGLCYWREPVPFPGNSASSSGRKLPGNLHVCRADNWGTSQLGPTGWFMPFWILA